MESMAFWASWHGQVCRFFQKGLIRPAKFSSSFKVPFLRFRVKGVSCKPLPLGMLFIVGVRIKALLNVRKGTTTLFPAIMEDSLRQEAFGRQSA